MTTASEKAAKLRKELAAAEKVVKAEREAEREEKRRKEREDNSKVISAYKGQNFDFTVGSEKYWLGITESFGSDVELSLHRWTQGEGSVNLTQDELKALVAGLQKFITD